MFSAPLNYLLMIKKPPNPFSLINIPKASRQTNKQTPHCKRWHFPRKAPSSLSHDLVICCESQIRWLKALSSAWSPWKPPFRYEEFRPKHVSVSMCNTHVSSDWLRLAPNSLWGSLPSRTRTSHVIAPFSPCLSGCEPDSEITVLI